MRASSLAAGFHRRRIVTDVVGATGGSIVPALAKVSQMLVAVPEVERLVHAPVHS